MMINHIGWIDPIAVIRVSQRMVVPMGKEEAWHYPIIGLIPRVWGAIPVRRGDVDPKTLRLAMNVLRAGEIVLVAPEGTRSPQLQEGLEGIAFLASRADVPIIPVALDHTEGFPSWPISPRWQEPGAHIRFGRPFRYHRALKRAKRAQLRAMTDEAMFVLAGLLPEWRRGVYGDISNATQETIEWL
jgi:1-acyl-sn-glycerol-3-phosphate acyltransferase